MASSKKNFNVQQFKVWINQQLKRTDEFATDKFKSGLCIALEHVLQQTGQYKGYNDNYWQEKGFREWLAAGQPDFPEKDRFIYGPTGQKFNRHYY
jgi:hypothetical protein